MECKEVLDRMMRALDDELPEWEWLARKAHLAVCDRCRTRWERLQTAEEVLRRAPLVSPPPGFVGRVMAQVDRRRARQRVFFGGLVLATGTAGVLIAGFLPLLWILTGLAGSALAISRSGGILLEHLIGTGRLFLNALEVQASALVIPAVPLALCSLMTALLLGGLWWSLLRRWQPASS